MEYAQNAVSSLNQTAASRIQSDTKKLQDFAMRIKQAESRIVSHARAMGYYEPQPESVGTKPTPISISMLDAISDLDRAIDSLSGSLNLFD
jgi:hypothetical protein